MRWLTRIVAALLVVLALAALVLHWVIVPRIDGFRPRLEQLATQAIGTPVHIGALRAESNGLVPAVSLHDVQVHDADGRVGLRVPRVLAAFSVLSLASGGLEQLVIEQPELDVRRTAEGRLLVGGIDLSGDASGDTGVADWFFSQEEFLVLGGRVRWVDERRAVEPVTLHDVQIVMRNGRRRHQMRLDATPDAAWGQRFSVVGRFRQPLFSRHPGYWQEWDGQVFADFSRVDVSRLRQYADLKTEWGVDVRRGSGALRLWADVHQGRPTSATADVALGAVEVTLGPKLAPLAFASLTGRLGWRGGDGALSVSTEGLQFVDADGLAWPGGNFRLSLREPQAAPTAQAGGGEISGDKLDLAALAKIASRLPLPPAVHQHLKDHPVQGLVDTLSARWDGALDAPADWRVYARLSGLSVGARPAPPGPDGKPVEGIPGIEGAALTLSATPGGGQATLSIRNGALTFPGVFEEPRIALTQLDTQANWQVKDGHITLHVPELKLANADTAGRFQAHWRTFDAKTAAAEGRRFPGVLDLQGTFSHADGTRIHRYLPLGVGPEARRYVRAAILKGQARNVAVRVKGDLRQVARPNPPAGTEFRFAGQVSGVTMAYVPRSLQPQEQAPWPALEDVSGELVFEHASMQVNNASARVQGHPGWRFGRVQARIDDLAHTRVLVDAEGSGALDAALGIVRASPVAGLTRHALDKAHATGDAHLQLKLNLPIDQINQAKASGQLSFAGNDLRVTPDAPLLAQVHGSVPFSETGFALRDVRAHLLGGLAHIQGGMGGEHARQGEDPGAAVVVRASGTATAEALRAMTQWAPLPAIARQASGSAAYEAELRFASDAPDVRVRSDLRGMAFDLPEPLNKPADAAWPLLYESRQQATASPSSAPGAPGSQPQAPAGRDHFRVQVADRLALVYERDTLASPARVQRGAVGIGPQATQDLRLPDSGVAAHLRLPRVSVDAWEDALTRVFGAASDTAEASASESPPMGQADANAAAQDSPAGTPSSAAARTASTGDTDGYIPTAWAVQADEVQWGEHTLHALQGRGTRQGRTWQADVQARELAGRIEYGQGSAGRAGQLRARLSRLSIPARREGGAPATQAEPPRHLPALDVVVQDFELRGIPLGQLQMQAINRDAAPGRHSGPDTQEWLLTHLSLHTPEATLNAQGRWATRAGAPALPVDARAPLPADEPRRTELDLTLDIHDAGALLARFDMPGVLARGRGQLHGSLAWAGAPLSPHYPSMDGQLHLDVGAGQFLKADPGMAKLLGVLSLQALPRRLTLDFRDLFSAGFAFDSIRGDVRLTRGQAHTNNLQMKGASAAVLMEGSANLVRETQNLRVLVVPEIDAGTAALVATAINPAIGIGAFLTQWVLQKPLAKAATREFHITGTWDDPQVTPVNARAAATGASPAASAAPAPSASAPADAAASSPPAAAPPVPPDTATENPP